MAKCFKCGISDREKRIVSHHEQYEMPEILIDLCYSCHRKRHNDLNIRGINPISHKMSNKMVYVSVDPMTFWNLTKLQKKWNKKFKRTDTVTEVIKILLEKNG